MALQYLTTMNSKFTDKALWAKTKSLDHDYRFYFLFYPSCFNCYFWSNRFIYWRFIKKVFVIVLNKTTLYLKRFNRNLDLFEIAQIKYVLLNYILQSYIQPYWNIYENLRLTNIMLLLLLSPVVKITSVYTNSQKRI